VRLHAPIGLAIGGDSPGEIAIGVLAQVIQVRRGERAARSADRPVAVEAGAYA
jgi:xanthine/CO dehydrogenase XdhC/CoxF family maturation factor